MFVRRIACRLGSVASVLPLLLTVCAAQGDDAPPAESAVEYDIVFISPTTGGVHAYRSGRWGVLRLNVVNPSEQPVDVLASTYFDEAPTLQYGRRLWLPPQSRMQAFSPIRVPENPMDSSRINFHTIFAHGGSDRDILIRDEAGKMELAGVLPLKSGAITAMLLSSTGADSDSGRPMGPDDWVRVLRIENELSPSVALLGEDRIPAEKEWFEALDHLVLAGDQLIGDQAAMSAVRRWLHGGGRLWIMLDRVSPELPHALLGDTFDLHIVDRIGLTDLDFEAVSYSGQKPDVLNVQLEEPAAMVRIVAGNAEPQVLVNDWPAAIVQPYGSGELLITTLDSRAWLRRRSSHEQIVSSDPERQTPFITILPGRPLFEAFLRLEDERRPVQEALAPELGGHFGRSVPSRPAIAGVLLGFVASLVALGIRLHAVGRLERIAWGAPALALVFSGGLVLAARQQYGGIPDSAIRLQVVEPIAGTNDVALSGVAGQFSNGSGTAVLAGTEGGYCLPDMDGMGGATRRLIWSDSRAWRWEGLPQSPGLRAATLQVGTHSPEPIVARAEFGPDGLSGFITLPPGLQPEDVILAAPAGRHGVRLGSDGSILISSDEMLAPGQYLPAAILSDSQMRRSRILDKLLTPAGVGGDSGARLLFWTGPWADGLRFGDRIDASGESLVVVTVELERPRAGAVVSVPPSFLPFREETGPDGWPPSGLYDNRKHDWSQKSRPSTSWFKLQVPKVLLPAAPDSARIDLRVTGPVGKLELALADGAEPVPVKTWIDPVGALSFEIQDPDLLQLHPAGAFYVRVSGGDPDRPELTNPDPDGAGKLSYWQLESLSVSLRLRLPGDNE